MFIGDLWRRIRFLVTDRYFDGDLEDEMRLHMALREERLVERGLPPDAARREAREISIAFLAGATPVPDTTGIKRTTAAVGTTPAGSLLYKARGWILGDSELATAAVVTPPPPPCSSTVSPSARCA